MTERSTKTEKRRCALGMAAAAAVTLSAFVVTTAPTLTDASWTSAKSLAVTATAVTPAPPTNLVCTSSSGILASSIGFSWTPPTGTAPSGYTLSWTGAATGSTSTTGSATTASIASNTVLLGSITVKVYANYGGWQSAAGTQTRTATIIVLGVTWGCS